MIYIYIYIYDGNICKNKTFSKTKIRVLADSLSTQIYSLKHIFREMKRQRRETMSVSLRSEHEAKMGQPRTYKTSHQFIEEIKYNIFSY